MNGDVFVGQWTYRSFINDPDLSKRPQDLLFGLGTISIVRTAPGILSGTIGGAGWSLDLHGSRSYGNPMEIRFQGKGIVDNHEWIYAYVGYLVPEWPNGINQATAMVGSTVRVIAHPGSDGKIHKAGVVASWYAVNQSRPKPDSSGARRPRSKAKGPRKRSGG